MKRVLTLILAAGAALATLSVGSAHAFGQASWPTQSRGDKGADVVAIQYLIVHSGQSIAVDGDFGGGTDAAVRSFQRTKDLDVDGRVGPNTWSALAVTLRQGNENTAVKALQYQLNAKRGAGLSVDGDFGPATRAAVVSFQRHAGIGVDGVVGQTTWRNLIWHYQQIDRPNVPQTCQFASSVNGHNAHWGTGSTVGWLTAAAGRVHSVGLGPVAVRDISLEHGGPIADHSSHEHGLDADLHPMRTDRAQCSGQVDRFSSLYDRSATRELVRALRGTGRVKSIYFNDPVLISEGLTTRWPNHDDHLHVRYCEVVHSDSRYDC